MPLLTVPDCRQADDHSCADAALACVLRFHRIAAAPRVATLADGADPRTLEMALRRLRLSVVSGEMTLGDLAYYCRTDRPPIVLVHWPRDSHSHYLTVRGVSPAGGWVYFQDPETGRGRRPAAEFEAAWLAQGRLGESFRRWAVVGWPPPPKT